MTKKVLKLEDDEDVKDAEVIDQDLDTFFNVLAGKQRKSWIKEEMICRSRLSMERLNQQSFESLVTKDSHFKRKDKPKLQDIHNYDLLSDPKYQDEFVYVPAERAKRRADCAISQYKNKSIRKLAFDVVRLVVDMPYLPEERAKNLKFHTKYLYNEYLKAKMASKIKARLGKSNIPGGLGGGSSILDKLKKK